ncbi:TetR/AcrR family transcriptional regulator [Actinocorallia sp. A-T 12471]|uniref:TetR/AcrR family transcriptional regulator n=1 Tax=Actinocorallia sp. A-T 12471 TaxID=3089813 RepID=UPI0029CC306C|nr:TetR family transcriptional regulator [Actinocorallia sp. A-T 12471]MDX6741932.1 TetR family transcriptional regulator [Actinocorallia sp. A-T 12471]
MTTRTYGGVAAADRRAERRAALLKAALDLLGTEGLRATTLRAVCARTGLNQRYFYESFADLDALLAAVYDGIAAETARAATRAVLAAGPEADLRDVVRAAAEAVLELGGADPRKARIALVEAPASPVLRARSKAAQRQCADLIARYARDRYGVPQGSDALIGFTSVMLVSGWTGALTAWLDGEIPASAAELAAMFADAAHTAAQAAAQGTSVKGSERKPATTDEPL